jgi:hypothetical protein
MIEKDKKESNVDRSMSAINSALQELEGVCSVSYQLYETVLTQVVNVKDNCEGDKCSPSSNLVGRLEDILERIIRITNKYVEFNKRCDL